MKKANKKILAMAAATALVFGFSVKAADNNVVYDDDDHGVITLSDELTKITNAADGRVDANSHDVMTGNNLYQVKSALDENISQLTTISSQTQKNISSQSELITKIMSDETSMKTDINTGFQLYVNGDREWNVGLGKDTSNSKALSLSTGDNMKIDLDYSTHTLTFGVKDNGKVEAGNTGVVTGDTVYQAIKDMPTDASFAGKASTGLDNLNAAGEKKIADAAEAAAKTATADKANTDASNIDAAKYSEKLATGSVTDGNTGIVTGGNVYSFVTEQNFAKADASNIDVNAFSTKLGTGEVKEADTSLVTGGTVYTAVSTKANNDASGIDTAKWQAALGTGTNAEADKGLVTGDTLHKALAGFTGGKTYTAGDGIAISDTNAISVKTGNVAEGDNGFVTGDTVKKAIAQATEGIPTEANVANKANKDLDNISDAGKQVIKDTVSDDLAKKADISSVYTKNEVDTKLAEKADTSLSNITDAGKQVIKDTMADDLAKKADKTYVDTELGKKADKTELDKVSNRVDENTTAIANKADKSYVDTGLAKKADASSVYTKTETDSKINTATNGLSTAIAAKADKTELDKVSGKVNDNTAAIAKKADADGNNINASKFTEKLDTGSIERDNGGLVSGGKVFTAINTLKEQTGTGLVTVENGTVRVAPDSEAKSVNFAGTNGSRVVYGVATDPTIASSAANVRYVNSTAAGLQNEMNSMSHRLTEDIKDAGAVGAALAGLHHLDYDPDNKLDVSVATGTYRGTTAGALGLFYQPNENMMVSAGTTMGADHNAFNVGLSFKIGRGSSVGTTSKAAMAAEIRQLKADKEAQAEKIKDLEDKVAFLMQKMELSENVEKSIVK